MVEALDGPRIELLNGEVCAFAGAWRKSVPCFIITGASGVYGKATLTNYRVSSKQLVVQADDEDFYFNTGLRKEMFDFPLFLIEKISKTKTRHNITLELFGKDGRFLALTFNQTVNEEYSLYKALHAMAFPPLVRARFCFSHKCTGSEDGWYLYDPLKELQRMGVSEDVSHIWQIVDNQEGEICSTYPPFFALPAGLSNSDILACAGFRKQNRLPALVWVSPANSATLWRASQPKVVSN
jgi:hypothetical protein